MKKSLLIAGITSILSCGMVIGLAATTNSNVELKPTYQVEAYTRVDSTITIPEGAAIAGNAFYVNLINVKDWWYTYEEESVKYDTETWAYFFNNNSENAWVHLEQTVSNDKYVLEVAVPSGYTGDNYWSKVVVCRSRGGQGDATWSNIFNQTGNMDVNASGTNKVTVYDTEWWDEKEQKHKKDAASGTYEAFTRIAKWCANSAQWNDYSVCHDSSKGSDTNKNELKDSWEYTITTYNSIPGADVKEYFKRTNGVEGDGDDTTPEETALDRMARYDWVYNRYHESLGLVDFAGRFVVE
jgi:hypothetical protein